MAAPRVLDGSFEAQSGGGTWARLTYLSVPLGSPSQSPGQLCPASFLLSEQLPLAGPQVMLVSLVFSVPCSGHDLLGWWAGWSP